MRKLVHQTYNASSKGSFRCITCIKTLCHSHATRSAAVGSHCLHCRSSCLYTQHTRAQQQDVFYILLYSPQADRMRSKAFVQLQHAYVTQLLRYPPAPEHILSICIRNAALATLGFLHLLARARLRHGCCNISWTERMLRNQRASTTHMTIHLFPNLANESWALSSLQELIGVNFQRDSELIVDVSQPVGFVYVAVVAVQGVP
mmetsp:Transcript_17568/g.34039  ORF Transcript_17568/g.34039 Transcript_17568/m.34039 type:complete len:203 (-) Transcript_17568:117-725(-)